jgi:hypothetical protein
VRKNLKENNYGESTDTRRAAAEGTQDGEERAGGIGFGRAIFRACAASPPVTRNDQLMSRLREIGYGPGDLDARVQAAVTAVQDERLRFPNSDAGQIQWNWYVGQLARDIWFECDRLSMLARKRAKPGEPLSGPMLELFGRLRPRILSLKESGDEPIRLVSQG